MQSLLDNYFTFAGKDNIDKIKIIDELNPYIVLEKYIPKYVENDLYKDTIKNEWIKKEYDFKVDQELYDKIVNNKDFGTLFNGKFYHDVVNKFIAKNMEKKNMPIKAQFVPLIYNLYKYWQLHDEHNDVIKFNSGIKLDYGIFIYNLIIRNKFTKTLEIGLAYGSSALFICSALKNLESTGLKTYHYAVDPNQTKQWKSIARLNIQRLGYKNATIVEEPDYLGLPKILKERVENKKWLGSKFEPTYERFQLIFIDGWHTFDYTLLDFFYADLLLEAGGYMIVDDAKFDALKELDKYLYSNYKFYEKVHYEMSLFMVYKKIKDDDRSWDFHVKFINNN